MRIECAYKELVELSSIVPHPSNRNKHSQRQIQALAKIIAKVGQRSPIVISTRSMYVVKGHGRLEAIKLLGWDKCAVDYQQYDSDLEELNDRIADNEIARYSEFDGNGFIEELTQLGLDTSDIDFEEFGKLDFIDNGQSNDLSELDDMSIEKLDDVNIKGETVQGNYFLVITCDNKAEEEECREKLGMKVDQRSIKFKDCILHD